MPSSSDDASDISQSSQSRPESGGGTFGHTRRDIIALNIDRRLSATASRAPEIGRKMRSNPSGSLSPFLSLSLPLSLSFSTRPLRRFVYAAIRVSTHTRCAHNRLREAKAPLIPSPALLLAFSPASVAPVAPSLLLSFSSIALSRSLSICLSLSISFSPRTLQRAFGRGSHRLLLECFAFVPSRSRPGRWTVLRLREKEAPCCVQPATLRAPPPSHSLSVTYLSLFLPFYLSTT